MPRRGRGGKAKIPASRRSIRLARLHGADTIELALSNEHMKEVDLFENHFDQKISKYEQSIGQAELKNDNPQSDLVNDDSKELNNIENLDQERFGPACTQQSIGRAESKKSSKTNVSVPEDAEQSDNVLNDLATFEPIDQQKTIETEPEKTFTLATPAANANQDKIALLDDKRPAASALQVEPENVPDIHIDDVLDIVENKVSENLKHQTERMFDLIEDLQRLNQSQWGNCNTLKDGLDKLQFLKERANQIKRQSMDLPEFQERRPLSDMPEYGYIKRLIQAWQEVKKHVMTAKDIVHTLPISLKPKTKPGKTPSNVGSSTSSMVSELRAKNAMKNKELDERLKDLAARSINANNNMKKMYCSEKGRDMNQLLDQTIPPIEKQMPKTVIGITNEDGSRDGDLKIKDVSSKNKTSASIENNKDNLSPPPRILPRGDKLENYLEDHPSIDLERRRNFNIKTKQSSGPFDHANNWAEDIFPDDSVSQFSRSRFRGRNGQGYFGNGKNRDFSPEPNDWVCIVTEKHPETDKPLHHGKIKSSLRTRFA